MTRFALPFLAVVALSGCSSPVARPNLIVLSVDTLRADHLSCYGSEEVSTPGFDRIAREGVLFENASSVAPTTLPAHASLLTATPPYTHLVRDNLGFRLRKDLPTLASTLKAAGYRTGGFVGSFVLNRKFGLDRGFDVYSDETPESDRGLRERRGEQVLEAALAFIESESETPFFAFLHFFDPHRPYDPPPAFAPRKSELDALYRGEVRYVDSLVQELLSVLDERGLTDSTVVVVTADHGESLGEHGEDTHGFFLYEATLRVPLLLRAPAIHPDARGHRVQELVRTIDVAPTALALLGVESPSSFEGVSFVSTSGRLEPREVEAYAETFVPRLHYGWSELRSLRRGSAKLVLAPRSELYRLDSDPREERNRIDEDATLAAELRARLLELSPASNVEPESIDRGTLASLRALGYLGESTATAAPERAYSELSDPKDKLALYRELNELTAVAHATPSVAERLARAIEEETESTIARSMYGNALLDLGRSVEAREAFERLLAMNPDSYDGHYGLGRALTELGQPDAARSSLEKALELDPGSAEVYYRLAVLERSQGKLDDSEQLLRRGIDVAPRGVLYQELADVLLTSNREEELSEMAREWQGTGAEGAAAYARGQLLAARGQTEGALVELARASRLAPEDDNVEQALANALSELGRFDEASEHYQAILARSPCYLGALTNVGAIHERAGRVDDAIRFYQRAVECDASYAPAHRNLGAALARRGEIRPALEALRNAQRLRPEDSELASAIAELERMIR